MIEKYLLILLNRLATRPLTKMSLRRAGKRFKLAYGSILNNAENIVIGDDFYAGPFFYSSTSKDALIRIGSKVMFGPGCKVIGGNHNIGWDQGHMMDAPHSTQDKGITIEDGVWVGAGSTILDGAVVGEGSVIAAGSIVVGRVPPYVIAMGVPAKRFRRRFDNESLQRILETTGSAYKLDQLLDEYLCAGLVSTN